MWTADSFLLSSASQHWMSFWEMMFQCLLLCLFMWMFICSIWCLLHARWCICVDCDWRETWLIFERSRLCCVLRATDVMRWMKCLHTPCSADTPTLYTTTHRGLRMTGCLYRLSTVTVGVCHHCWPSVEPMVVNTSVRRSWSSWRCTLLLGSSIFTHTALYTST